MLLEFCREKLMSDDDFLVIECVSAFDHETLAQAPARPGGGGRPNLEV